MHFLKRFSRGRQKSWNFVFLPETRKQSFFAEIFKPLPTLMIGSTRSTERDRLRPSTLRATVLIIWQLFAMYTKIFYLNLVCDRDYPQVRGNDSTTFRRDSCSHLCSVPLSRQRHSDRQCSDRGRSCKMPKIQSPLLIATSRNWNHLCVWQINCPLFAQP